MREVYLRLAVNFSGQLLIDKKALRIAERGRETLSSQLSSLILLACSWIQELPNVDRAQHHLQ